MTKPQRIVSLCPSITETLVAIGALGAAMPPAQALATAAIGSFVAGTIGTIGAATATARFAGRFA